MANNGIPLSPRKTKECQWCLEPIVQQRTEGIAYFARKKYCSQACNGHARHDKRMSKEAPAGLPSFANVMDGPLVGKALERRVARDEERLVAALTSSLVKFKAVAGRFYKSVDISIDTGELLHPKTKENMGTVLTGVSVKLTLGELND